jgi:hypothetical protein
MEQLRDRINGMKDKLKSFKDDSKVWKHDVENRLTTPRASDVASPGTGILQGNDELRPHKASCLLPGYAEASTPNKQEAFSSKTQHRATPADSERTVMRRATDAESQDKAGLRSDHTTPAHKLLEDWPAMQNWWRGSPFLAELKSQNVPLSSYPLWLEERRGIVRPWGYGEGLDLKDEAQEPESPDGSSESEVSPPAPEKEDLLGHRPPDKPISHPINGSRPEEDHPGGLGADGKLDFRVATLDALRESYERNMHSLHPVLDRHMILKTFQKFKDQYSPDARPSNTMSPAAHQVSIGIERTRSSSVFGEPYHPRGAVERSLSNAIVLLILALGKVCSYKWRKPLPSPKSDRSPHTTRGASGSGPDTLDGSLGSDTFEDRERNIDIIPGMAYYAYATDILGNHHGGLTITHAQAFILAALYISQFARVMESWGWISSACRTTIVLLKV